jgi:hypothetical protein
VKQLLRSYIDILPEGWKCVRLRKLDYSPNNSCHVARILQVLLTRHDYMCTCAHGTLENFDFASRCRCCFPTDRSATQCLHEKCMCRAWEQCVVDQSTCVDHRMCPNAGCMLESGVVCPASVVPSSGARLPMILRPGSTFNVQCSALKSYVNLCM